jgi:ABC-type multidrug transport system, ATPase component
MPAALSVERLVKQYRSGPWGKTEMVKALDGVSISASAGEVLAITGPHGSGKSTLLLCAAGLVRPDGGSISWFGSRLIGRAVPPGLSYVAQRASYYSFLTVREALEYYATLHDLRTDDRARQVDRAVREVSLTEHASRRVGCLAPPVLRRLGLAQALIGTPRAVLLDETLDDGLLRCKIVRAVLERLSASGVTVLVASKDADDIESVADRVVRLSCGRIVKRMETAGFDSVSSSRGARVLVN